MVLDRAAVQEVVRRALGEDLGESGDLTTKLCVPAGKTGVARIVARQPGVIAGLAIAHACFSFLDAGARIETSRSDGDRLQAGDVVLVVSGKAAALCAGERTCLNLLQRLSGIATLTSAFVAAVEGTGARILDTRKTTPGLRALEKHAVVAGGGHNHRFGLFDQVLIKENHFALARPLAMEEVVRRAVAGSKAPVVAEARDLTEARAVVRGGAAVVLLDNFEPGDGLRSTVAAVRELAAQLKRSVEIEVSGGISLRTVRLFAECGVDRISVGALTHSSPALDLSMLVEVSA
jgi:nicotinate-nucleotide pyrophosphorylase (carboxylating)